MLKQKKGQASECVTHVCHASRHVPIYRGISRFLLWRWGGNYRAALLAICARARKSANLADCHHFIHDSIRPIYPA